MRYDVIIPNPFDSDKRIIIRLPLDIVGISRLDGERWVNVSGMNFAFDEEGNDYMINSMDIGE